MAVSIKMSDVVARDEFHAAELIGGWVQECRRGASDREADAVSMAEAHGLEIDPVHERFAVARNLRALAKPVEVIKRRRLPPDDPPSATRLRVGRRETEAALKVSGTAEPAGRIQLPAVVPAPKTLALPGPDDAVAALNSRHAVIENVGGKTVIAGWEPSQLDPGRMVVVFQHKESFLLRYSNRHATIDVPDGRGGSRQTVMQL